MALLKTKELRAMRPEDMQAKLKEFLDELMHERGVAAMGGAPASPGKIRSLRTNIARIHTVVREKELADEKKTKKAGPDSADKKAPKKGKAKEKKAGKQQEEKK